MVKITSSEKQSDETKPKRKWGKKEKTITGIAIVIFVIVLISIGGGDNKTPSHSPTSQPSANENNKLGIGEEGIINFREDKNDCGGEDKIVLGTTKEAQDKVNKALLAKDYIGIAKLILVGEAFSVDICTRGKVIDRAFGLREVRIMEGENFGESGWLPYEWIK